MMREKTLKRTVGTQPMFQTVLSFCFIIFVGLCFFASYIISTEQNLHHLAARMETLESALTQLKAELEVVHEVFSEAQKIKEHIQKRSKISSEQATEISYALLHCAHE